MATIKSFTSLEQSKKLAEILPLESADMYYSKYDTIHAETLYSPCDIQYFNIHEHTPCWSLAALLSVLPSYFYDETGRKTLGMSKGDTYYYIFYENKNSYIEKKAGNPVDACVAMIEHLHELKML